MRTKKVELKPTLDNTIQRKKLASATMKNAFRIGNKVIAYVPVELLNNCDMTISKEASFFCLTKCEYEETNSFRYIQGQSVYH